MEHDKFKAFGESQQLLMQEFAEVGRSLYATPEEKKAVQLGFIAAIKLQEYTDRKKNLPFAFSDFSEGVSAFREVANCWADFENACEACRKFRARVHGD